MALDARVRAYLRSSQVSHGTVLRHLREDHGRDAKGHAPVGWLRASHVSLHEGIAAGRAGHEHLVCPFCDGVMRIEEPADPTGEAHRDCAEDYVAQREGERRLMEDQPLISREVEP